MNKAKASAMSDYFNSVGAYWAEDNKRFSQSNPSTFSSVVRHINPITSFGASVGEVYDAAGRGNITEALAHTIGAVPVFGKVVKLKGVQGDILKNAYQATLKRMAIDALMEQGINTAYQDK